MMMQTTKQRVPVALIVNSKKITAEVEPRLHLGDFLRDHLRLTGTHLGCEHGVCGACTVLLNDVPVRACITYAVACDGLEVRTIEGFEKDENMALLRETFVQEHGLQCGFCTPGMLITARDILLRLPTADERQVRVELSGNLCRCTGYKGTVNAICAALKRRSQAVAETKPVSPARSQTEFTTFTPGQDQLPVTPPQKSNAAEDVGLDQKGWTHVEDSFVIHLPPARVWTAFRDLPLLAACLPGAELQEHDENSVKGQIKVKLGPITASFFGAAAIERDEKTLSGRIRGGGSDQRSGSRTRGELTYQLVPQYGGETTKVLIKIDYVLQGSLAQFSRTGIAQEMGRVLVAQFADNLNHNVATTDRAIPNSASKPLSAWQVFRKAFLNLFR